MLSVDLLVCHESHTIRLLLKAEACFIYPFTSILYTCISSLSQDTFMHTLEVATLEDDFRLISTCMYVMHP